MMSIVFSIHINPAAAHCGREVEEEEESRSDTRLLTAFHGAPRRRGKRDDPCDDDDGCLETKGEK